MRCFEVQGYHATKMSDVAATAELAKGSLYRYFKSKGQLTEALVQGYFDAIRTQVSAFPPPPTLAIMMIGLRAALPEERLGATRMFFDVLGPGFAQEDGARQVVDGFMTWIGQHYGNHLRLLQQTGQVRGDLDPEITGATIAAMLDGLVMREALYPHAETPFAAARDAAISLLEQGLRPL